MTLRKIPVKELKKMLPESKTHAAFLKRDDIKDLPPQDQQDRWDEHKIKLDKFFQQLSNLDAAVISA